VKATKRKSRPRAHKHPTVTHDEARMLALLKAGHHLLEAIHEARILMKAVYAHLASGGADELLAASLARITADYKRRGLLD